VGGRRAPGVESAARPKTIFATHYHELTDLADALAGVVNFHVAAREYKDDIVFLHKIVRAIGSQLRHPGGAPRRLAPSVVRRATRSSDRSRKTNCGAAAGQPERQPGADQKQLGLFQARHAVPSACGRSKSACAQIDVNQMTPLEALTILAELKREAGE
jgi:DNA mismatch repair protein MutS